HNSNVASVVQVGPGGNRTTTLAYDHLDRLIRTTDELGNPVKYGYDKADRVVSVTDPNGKKTTYTYDGFGQLWKLVSPDTGITTFQYDVRGLRASMTRAGGAVSTYGYDALGRLTSVAAGGETQTFAYDTCTRGKGRLCKVTDPHGELTYTYSPQGQVLSQGQRIGTSSVKDHLNNTA